MKLSNRILYVCSGLVLVIALGACDDQKNAGVIGYRQGAAGIESIAPEIPYIDNAGRVRKLSDVRQDIAVVIFTTIPQDKPCNWVDPRIRDAAQRFWDDPVSVVQITIPDAHCTRGPGATPGTPKIDGYIGLSDENKLAWNAYGRPKSGTVYLLDENNAIVSIATVDNMGALLDEAKNLAIQIEKQYQGEDDSVRFIGVGP